MVSGAITLDAEQVTTWLLGIHHAQIYAIGLTCWSAGVAGQITRGGAAAPPYQGQFQD